MDKINNSDELVNNWFSQAHPESDIDDISEMYVEFINKQIAKSKKNGESLSSFLNRILLKDK